jgi:Tol biopolymer transport system component
MGALVDRTRLAAATASVAALAAAIALCTSGAEATFPGDNGRIAFSSDRQGGPGIFTVAASGRDVERVTEGDDAVPAVSPNGKRIVYERDAQSGPDIIVMNADGSGKKPVLDGPKNDSEPDWGPSPPG